MKENRTVILEMTELVDNSDFKGLPRVTNPQTFGQNNIPTPDGLYSEIIFGRNLKDQSSKFAYIELGTLNNFEQKLHNLKLFYDQYIDYIGTGDYEKLSLKFVNQVVATKRIINGKQE